ncbi:ribokinase [Cohaesibacter gelatinilyticus]|uniref:Ribokinase n=1 Tax=Cohaesibacter gelatinilyticus TaxID=372072 RepID=A0A285PEP5_9HYPH|nr:ribokinase [Cohaesibacter gelatinilyticus]SNZ20199.1 ribokinase [Cohaesibacter gelatinilyticus]
MSISVFGSINIDLTTYAQTLPAPGETLLADRYVLGLGGKGCNQAAAVAKLGADPVLVGRVGVDSFGKSALEEIGKLGLSTSHVHIDQDNNSGLAVIGVDAKAENSISVIGGANMAIDQSDVARADDVFKAVNILLLQMEIPLKAAMQAAEKVRTNGGLVVLDPAPAPKVGLSEDILGHIDIITPNETETEILTGIRPRNREEAAQAARLLRERGVSIAIIKLGAKGVYFQSSHEEAFVEPFKVSSIDSVAAGDCFNGGLAFALDEGMPLVEAVTFASACGALSTTKKGASASAPTREEVETLLRSCMFNP